MALFVKLLSGLICLIMVLLILLYFNWEDPVQEDDESNEEFEKREHDAMCSYEGQRNILLVGLGVSMITCMYKMCKGQDDIIGGLIETMGSDEKNLYMSSKNSDPTLNSIKQDDDVISIT